MIVIEERMSPEFNKLNLQVGQFPLTLHHFTGPDRDDPHDHPFAFTTTVLRGGYVEQIWTRNFGRWAYITVERKPGKTHYVLATDIHKIVALLDKECVTSVEWHILGVARREPRFWRMPEGISRAWNEEYPS